MIEETLKNQLEEKEKIKESLEAEIVSLRKELQKKDIQQNFGNNTKILDEIINSQRPCYDKSGLGYKKTHTEKGSSSMTTGKEAEQKSYADVIRGPIKKEECKPSKENIQEMEIIQEEDHPIRGMQNQQPTMERTQEEDYKRVAPPRRSPTLRYQTIFLGLCYSCNNFGHKAINCRAYARNRSNYGGYPKNNYLRKPHESYNKNYNSFGSLNNEVECYKCNNFGHIAKDCRLIVPPREPKQDFNNHVKEPSRIWKRKQDELNIEECVISLQAQSRKSEWYVDSGCSKHMTGDKDIFVTLKKEKDGSVSFGNDNSTKIIGKGTIKLGSKDAMEENVLLVENMKHNLLSVSQMCDQGHTLLFNSKKCEIRKEGSGRLVATTIRTPNNIYILNEIGKERCCLGKEDESWLWHRRMGHMHFDNLVKINRKEVVREMPEISKPTNTMCKHCQHGKQTRVEFRTKEYSTTKPLEIVHTDLCGPMRTKG
jgi:hypothetical protein